MYKLPFTCDRWGKTINFSLLTISQLNWEHGSKIAIRNYLLSVVCKLFTCLANFAGSMIDFLLDCTFTKFTNTSCGIWNDSYYSKANLWFQGQCWQALRSFTHNNLVLFYLRVVQNVMVWDKSYFTQKYQLKGHMIFTLLLILFHLDHVCNHLKRSFEPIWIVQNMLHFRLFMSN